MSKKQLRIAYLSVNDPLNKRAWSGTHNSIYLALKKHLGEVVVLGQPKPGMLVSIGKLVTGLLQQITGKRYNYRHSLWLSKQYARFYEKKLQHTTYDLLVAPAASCEIASLTTTIPIIYISDTTFACSLNYHKSLCHLIKLSIREGFQIEQQALNSSSLIILSSEWARRPVIQDFHMPLSKTRVIPFGANMNALPSAQEVHARAYSSTCRLLFMGVYWESKGGGIAFNCLLHLLEMGLVAELTVCGCIPPPQFTHERLKIIPYIDKNTKEGQLQIAEIFNNSDFLVLPTRFDCTPIVFCEASAFGVPSIAAATGGVAGHIAEGVNGFLVDYADKGEAYARIIFRLFNDKTTYANLRKSSRNYYENFLNWELWAQKLKAALSENNIIQS